MNASNETLTALFLAELSALDAFAARREADGGHILGPEDPDVRRILEAMAFFSARTRAAAAESTASAMRRMAAGTLDDLLTVQPAAMMVEVASAEGALARGVLPRGTLLRAVTAEGKIGLFATTQSLAMEPLVLNEARIVEERRRGLVRIRLSASQAQKGRARVSLYVRRLDDYRASLALHDALERHLVRAFVRHAVDGPEQECRVHFGASPEPPDSLDEVRHDVDDRGPLARIRSFFHLPEQDLFVHVDVPAPRVAWTAIELFLELDEGFPTNLAVANDTFRLNVVPAENAWSDYAAPTLWDGTKTSVPVRSARALLEGVEPVGVRAVYRATDAGLVPVLPAALALGGDTYEVDTSGGDTRVILSLAGAFLNPCKVLAEARWSQPELWSAPPGRLSVSLQTRHLPGAMLRCVGAVRPPMASALARDPARCLDVLSLRMRPALSRRDLVGMLEILGAGDEGIFRGFASLVDALDCCEAPDPARRTGGVRRVYKLALRQRTPEEAPMVRRLARQIATLLDAWTEEPVDTEITTRPVAPVLKTLPGGARS